LKEKPLAAWKKKRKIMGRYNTTADSYNEQYEEEQRGKYKKALENVEVSGKKLLDVGCGSGLFFQEVVAQAQLVVGVDISLGLLRKANSQAKKLPVVFVVQADADHLPFTGEFFDSIFAFTVLQNMPKPAQTLAELKRLAAVGSRIVVTGLKKTYALDKFMDVLEDGGMRVAAFIDDQFLNCYIAVLSA
jgi:ubiquinone/menaquinone biosynthesis C-methylase UbiE